MWLMLQSKKQSRYGALKLLDFVTTRYALPCDKLVDLGVLKHIFGVFMGKAKIKGPRGEMARERRGREKGLKSFAGIQTPILRLAVEACGELMGSLSSIILSSSLKLHYIPHLCISLSQVDGMWRPRWRSAASLSSSTSSR